MIVGPRAGVQVGPVDRLRPDPDRVEGQQARLARPLHVPHRGRVRDLAADGGVPCNGYLDIKLTLKFVSSPHNKNN